MRAWIGAMAYVALLSLVGLILIPSAEEIVIRWSWGDWTPVGYASKGWALLLVPLVGAIVAWVTTARRRATGLDHILPAPALFELLAILVIVGTHSVIVLNAVI